MKGKILEDGSIEGKTFSGDGYEGGYPSPQKGESYRNYRARVDKLVEQGFHLGDLGWTDWGIYCMGSGSYEGVDSNDTI